MKKILVVCTGNTCRSPMAHGIVLNLIKNKGLENIIVSSGGLSAFDGDKAAFNAIVALEEIGIDISNHSSKLITKQDLQESDLIYVMTQEHKNMITNSLPNLADKIKVVNVSDPFGQNLDKYRQSRDFIKQYFEQELDNIGL